MIMRIMFTGNPFQLCDTAIPHTREAQVDTLPQHVTSCEHQIISAVGSCDPRRSTVEPICGSYGIVSTGAPPAAIA